MTSSNSGTNSTQQQQYSEYIIQENDGTTSTSIHGKLDDGDQESIGQHWHDADGNGGANGVHHQSGAGGGGGGANNDRNSSSAHNRSSTSSTDSGGEESSRTQHNQSNATGGDRSPIGRMGADGGIMLKTPNSYKYPLLRQYYNFGPWIGRNRKAICLRCRLQTSSSQPDRLLKHLNKCPKLTDSEKVAVQDLMNERTANKRKKPSHIRGRNNRDDQNDDSAEYYGDEPGRTDDSGNPLPIPPGGLKKLRKSEHTDRTSQIDEALTRWIMMCRVPLKTVNSQEFIDFVKTLCPDYRLPSRETITNILIPGMLDII